MKERLSELLTEGLEGVSLSSRSSDKFEGLAALLASEWGVPAEAVGVKALKDAKNFGNRVAEATRSRIDRLVLLAEGEVELDAVGRALVGKALFRVPTILGVRGERGWTITSAFVPAEAENPFGADIPARTVPPAEVASVEPTLASTVRREIQALTNAPVDTDVHAALKGRGRKGKVLVIKHVTESKNLANRIGEGLGPRPGFCVIIVPQGLEKAARGVVEELSEAAPTTNVFLLVQAEARLIVHELAKSRVSQQPAAPSEDPIEVDTKVAESSAVYGVSEPDAKVDRTAEYRTLERVRQLRRHLPLDANADDLYEEHLGSGERLRYETKTLGFLRELLGRSERVFVVLTGNAGHGKTHMCRRLLEHDASDVDVMERLRSDPVGGKDWVVATSTLPVRIIKDLSELNPPDAGAQRLEALLQQEHAHVIVCANEGRLRDVVERRPTNLRPILDVLEKGSIRGDTSLPERPDLHVVNLNYQAASAGESGGFLGHVLDHYLNHESGWKVCTSCMAQDRCPILANRHDLAMSPALADRNTVRREALGQLVQIVEESGYVLTYRETLVLVAYLVTGGLSCADVEQFHRKRGNRALDDPRLLNLLFEPRLSDDEADILKILQRIRRLDPGKVAIRTIDERLHQELEERDELGSGLFGESTRQLNTRAELRKEEEAHRAHLRAARRDAWLTSPDGRDRVARSERLGLRHHKRFRLLADDPDVRDVISTIRDLVKGLHTIQGAVGVDPAFGRSGSHSAIIARSIRIKDLELETESDWWSKNHAGQTPPVLESVEWIDRRLVLVERPTQEIILVLDLQVFEFVLSSGQGIVMRDFHSAERRRILRRLARLAEGGQESSDDIRVLLERGEGTLTVERDGTILLEHS